MNALTETDAANLKEALRRCAPATFDAAIRFREQGELDAIPQVVFGIIERYQPATAPVKLAEATGSMRLMEDIGLDSLTLLEIVMTIEEVLKLRIENNELRELRTLGQLNAFLEAKITGAKSKPAGKHYSREQIVLILPQQPPFLFLDSALVGENSVKADYKIKGDEFFLEGHFKNEPIFPASIVFEAMGQAACLWLLEKAPEQIGHALPSNQVFFASLDGAHFQRKTRPGEQLQFEVKLLKLRDPLAIFEGVVTSQNAPVARIERLVLAFGEQLQPEKFDATGEAPASQLNRMDAAPAVSQLPVADPALSRNGHH